MAIPHILLVDDDALMRRSLAFNLERANYRVSTAASAEDALGRARANHPDLVLLDIGLPGMDGLEALCHFHQELHLPVIFVTARRRELDQVVGLDLGADDYITKPFDTDVLIAHVKAVLRRSQPSAAVVKESTPLVLGDLTINSDAHAVTVGGQPVNLPPREFDLLCALALEAGRVVSVEDLLARVWGAEYKDDAQTLYVHIRWLREKLGDDLRQPRRIISFRGIGYKLQVVD
jgi:DNA-binding response OmpR family regulator